MQSENDVNISEVCQQTGVEAVTLRAWERRYGLIKPKRTPKGHRLYSEANIEEIRQIVSWLNRGVAIGKVAALLTAAEAPTQVPLNEDTWLDLQQEIMSCLIELKQRSLNPILDKLNKEMPFVSLCEKVYQPLVHQLKARWQDKPLGYQLEQQLWQQCWHRQMTVMALRADKRKARGHCWLVNIDIPDTTLDYWLFYGLLIQAGIRIHAVNQLDDLDTLPRLRKSLDQPIIVFGDTKIAPREINQLVKTKALCREGTIVIGRLADIHQDAFVSMAIDHVGGDASTCWQSVNYQAWLERLSSR